MKRVRIIPKTEIVCGNCGNTKYNLVDNKYKVVLCNCCGSKLNSSLFRFIGK